VGDGHAHEKCSRSERREESRVLQNLPAPAGDAAKPCPGGQLQRTYKDFEFFMGSSQFDYLRLIKVRLS
jgi:hypothetical protein